MKKLVALALMIGLTVAIVAPAQSPILTRPTIPERAALDRLNLRLAWRTQIPVEGRRDGIATVQNLGDVVIVQTRRGAVAALDPDTGAVRWFTNVGEPYPVTHDVGYNDELILVDNGTRIHALDRARGLQRWEINLPATPTSPPAADDHAIYVHLGNARVAAYAFPGHPSLQPGEPVKAPRMSVSAQAGMPNRTVRFSGVSDTRTGTVSGQVAASGTTGGRTATTGSEIIKQARGAGVADAPELLWFYQTNLRVKERPVIGANTLLLVSTDRFAVYLDKEYGEHPTEFTADSPFTAPAGKYGEIAYLGSRDGGVYALHMPTRVTLWHYTANSMVITAAVATDDEVFVAADRGGLIRLDRATGLPLWQNPAAQRFLAANPKFVYAFDNQGRLLVLERLRGQTLTTLETRAFVLPVVNEVTDRLFLAAHDGTILCLHDKAYPQPVRKQNPPAAGGGLDVKAGDVGPGR